MSEPASQSEDPTPLDLTAVVNPKASDPGWRAANLCTVGITRDSTGERHRFCRDLRRADIVESLHLGLGSLVVPLVGPMAFANARAELGRISRGEVLPHGRGWIVFAMVCSAVSTIQLLALVMIVTAYAIAGAP